jgi:hypothetical protein
MRRSAMTATSPVPKIAAAAIGIAPPAPVFGIPGVGVGVAATNVE